MFLDTITRPNKVESVIKTLNFLEKENVSNQTIYDLYQPKEVNESDVQDQIKATLKVLKRLSLIDDNNKLTFKLKPEEEIKDYVLKSFDEIVLNENSEEKWFALFYSFILSENKDISGSYEQYSTAFNKNKFGNEIRPTNQLNGTKLGHYFSWYNYIGLGQNQQKLIFVNPYHRIKRKLKIIFNEKNNLSMDQFVRKMGDACPELDGGNVFKIIENDWSLTNRKLSKGLQRSLVQLHIEKDLQLVSRSDARDFWIFEDVDLFKGSVVGLDTNQISGVQIFGEKK